MDRKDQPETSATGDALLEIEPLETLVPTRTPHEEAAEALTAALTHATAALTVEQLMRLGALKPEGKVTPVEFKAHLNYQQAAYHNYTKDELIAELVRRDETALRTGQEAADGRLQGRLIREFLRGVLHLADHATLGRIDRDRTKSGTVERILIALGAEPADAQALKRNGSSLGSLDTRPPAEAILDPHVPTTPRPDVAEDIRIHNQTTHVKETD